MEAFGIHRGKDSPPAAQGGDSRGGTGRQVPTVEYGAGL